MGDFNFDESLAGIRDSRKNICLLSYRGKDSKELTAIINTNNQLIQTMSSPSEVPRASALLGEIDACVEILNERKKVEQRKNEILETVRKAKKQWKNELADRRKEAILHLPVASSYLGQLIAAILESEDGKTAEEIAQWGEDLSTINESKFRSTLLSLVKEGILVFKDYKYFLINLCTETLFPENPLQWAKKKLILMGKENLLDDVSFVLEHSVEKIAETGEPIADTDDNFAEYSEKEILVDCGILQKHKCGSEDIYMYYFPMLGEQMGRKAK